MYISCRALSNMLRMLSKMALDFSACDNPSNDIWMQGFMHCLQAQAVSCQLVSVNQFERTTRYPAFIKPLSLQLNAAFELRNKVTVVPMVSQTVGLRSSGWTQTGNLQASIEQQDRARDISRKQLSHCLSTLFLKRLSKCDPQRSVSSELSGACVGFAGYNTGDWW